MPLPPMPCLYCPPDGPCSNCGDGGDSAPAPVAEAVTFDLSAPLDGVWADVFSRQDDLYAKRERKARTAWRKATADLDLAALVAAFRRHALMGDDGPAAGTDSESPEARKRHKAEILALARSMASGFLAGVNDQPDYSLLLAALTAALAASAGEGTASALAVSAAAAGYLAFDWAKATRDGKTAPGPGTATGWVAKIIAGAVTDLARSLAASAIAGLSADAMLKAASKVMRAGRSVTAFANQAMSTAVSAAMAAAYAALGDIELLDFLTAGDSLVCPTCDECADNGPYTIANYPGCQHSRCRCVPSPTGGLTLPFGVFAAYLVS